ncbi:MAG: CRTAC1 family protein [bacterium]|nr:CRTAC1 family protein [bacterium]
MRGIELSCALALLACAACGDGTNAAEGTTEPPARPAVNAGGPVPDSAARPVAPERVFNDRRPAPEGFDGFKQRFKASYAEDRWDTEILAALDERTWRAGGIALVGGDPAPLLAKLADDFEAPRGFVPNATEVLREGLGARVVRATGFADESVDRAAAASHLLALVAPLDGVDAPLADVAVTEIERKSKARFECRVHVRLGGKRGAGAVQLNLLLATAWEVQAAGPRIVRIEPLAYERVELDAVPFTDRLAAVAAGDLAHPGALELKGRHDRLTPGSTIALGMNGMGVGDLDGDGREDLYVARPAGFPNALLRQRADGTTEDIAPRAGVDLIDETAGVLIVDLDGDGARELVLAVDKRILIAWNAGDGTFGERTVLTKSKGEKVYSISAADADGDGDLDLYDTRYFRGHYGGGVPVPYHDAQNGGVNYFWRNAGERTFEEDTIAAGLDAGNGRFSLASVWEDLDEDGDLDLYVTNDFGRNNLYRNDGGGKFTDVALESGAVDMAAGMGVACADVDRDGDVDLYVSNMFSAAGRRVTSQPKFLSAQPPQMRAKYAEHARGNSLLLNDGTGRFERRSAEARVGHGGWTWGAVFTDFDADGLADLFVPNGFLTGTIDADLASFFWRVVVHASPLAPPADDAYKNAWIAITEMSQGEGLSWSGNERGYSYWNLGGGLFAEATLVTGLGALDDGRTACVVDWDGDGRLDVWVKNRTAPALRFLHNQHADSGAWAAFELSQPGANSEAVGALVEVEVAGESAPQRRRVYAGEGYLGGSSRRLHFGIGAARALEAVRVHWPTGEIEELTGVAPGALYRVRRGEAPERASRRKPLAAEPATAAAGAPERRTRVPLLARLPLAGLPLPRFDGGPAVVGEVTDRALLVALWGSWSEGGEEGVRGLAARGEALDEARLDVLPLALDSVRDEPYVRALTQSLGFTLGGGRADRETRQILEVFLLEVLGAFHDQPLPLGLLLDADGNLSSLYVGELDADAILADARTLRDARPEAVWPAPLTGGRWATDGPLRSYDALIEYIRPRAMPELLATLEAARADAFR